MSLRGTDDRKQTTDLRSKIVGCAAQRPSSPLAVLRETKVCNLYVTIVGEEDVLWLEVAVDDFVCVKVVEGHSHFRGIEFPHWVREPLKKNDKRDYTFR